MSGIHVGIDVGSTTVKLVALEPGVWTLGAHWYVRANGRPRETLLGLGRALEAACPGRPIATVGLSGSGGGPVARRVGGLHVNELVAQTRAVGLFHPEARTVIEIGGQDSKFLSVRRDGAPDRLVLEDFAMNALCAAGTGSFLDQQAERLGIAIDGEFARLALASRSPARVAGRCTVFAKSDMIHLQQQGTHLADILAGLCLALARNFRSIIGRGKAFTPPVLFQGGVAHNAAVVRAFEEVLGLPSGELIVPRHHDLMPAIGAAVVAAEEAEARGIPPFRGFEALEAPPGTSEGRGRSLPVLRTRTTGNGQEPAGPNGDGGGSGRLPVYLGVDVGSISTNVVLLDARDRLVARRYLATAGRPLEAVRRGLRELGREVGDRVEVRAVGATGSGRYLTGHFVGADTVRNEITAQARAAAALDPEVDTVFEIGGQDSKYIRLSGGAVVDFAMNNACAAGTGSFLEEQADRLGVSIRRDFAELALGAHAPACLGERCTVFMESDLVHHQQRGASVRDLAAGLAYSIVENYLNRVVDQRPVGRRVLFQGGVAGNASVAAAFEAATGRSVRVPPDHDVTGAIGAAILAREAMEGAGIPARTRFHGFDLDARRYESETFVCRACTNLCEVKRVTVAGEPPLFHGARCDRFEEAGRGVGTGTRDLPDLFAERTALLLGDWEDPGPRRPGRVRVGFPRTLVFHDLFPFWRAFFRVLDVDVVLSAETNGRILDATQRHAAADTCLPVKTVFGHVLDVLDRDVDRVFLPSIVDREGPAPGQANAHYCPLIPASAHMAVAHVDTAALGAPPILFPFHMGRPEGHARELRHLAGLLERSRGAVREAAEAGWAALADFEGAVRRRGREVLDGLDPARPNVVLVGRAYNTCDAGLCQDLPRKLRKLGALPIPVDFLPGRDVELGDAHRDMYWRSGQVILGAAHVIAADRRLQAVYLTSFGCGPDSFLKGYFRRILGARPFLELEVDEHTAEAGILTRCEAFLDSLRLLHPAPAAREAP